MTTPHHPAESSNESRLLSRLAERYRYEQQSRQVWNETIDTLLAHRSVRTYLPDPVPDGTVELLVAAAQSAASSSNLQPWSVIAVEEPQRKARLAALAGNQKHIAEAPLFLVWLIDLHRLQKIGESEETPSEALEYLESFLLGSVDTALAAQNAVVALESLGLGSVYIGGIRNKPVEVAAELGLPPHVFALFGLVVGHPDPTAPAAVKPRLPQDTVLFREQYGTGTGPEEPHAAYNERLRAFQQEQSLPQRDWTELVAQRVRGQDSLAGRHLLRQALSELGFGLT